jgi:hypothetical protein
MRRDAVKVGEVYAVKVRAEDVPIEEDPEILEEGLGSNWLFSSRHAIKNRLVGYNGYNGEILPYPVENKAVITKGRALRLEVIPSGAFVTFEVEWRVAQRCPTCHQGLIYDHNDEVVYDVGALTVVVPLRRVLNTWEGWQADVAARRFEGDDWARQWVASQEGDR